MGYSLGSLDFRFSQTQPQVAEIADLAYGRAGTATQAVTSVSRWGELGRARDELVGSVRCCPLLHFLPRFSLDASRLAAARRSAAILYSFLAEKENR